MNDPLIGQQLANFRVDHLLGSGGMAQVYYGQDIKLQRPVAIKVIDTHFRNNPSYAQRFIKEARVMAKWRHENIIQIYYADDQGGLYYYVMEYIDGQDLASFMAYYAEEGELMPVSDILRVGHSVANALDYAHAQGVVHRDIKPSNVMVAKDGRVVLGDFGMALDVRDGSLGDVFGTPHYISPEQARRSADAIPQSDLYSFGVILYEILTGAVPFNDPSPASIALQHITTPPPAPRSINPDLPMEVEAVLLKALEKDPKDRFQSAAKLMDALEKALTVTKMSSRLAMPPLPVGVPTIHHSSTSIAELTQRGVTRQAAPATRMAARPQPATVRATEGPPLRPPPGPDPIKAAESAPLPQGIRRTTTSPLWGLLVLVLIGTAFLYFNPKMFASINLPFLSTATSTPLPPTATANPAPTLTATTAPTSIPTETSAPTLAPSATSEAVIVPPLVTTETATPTLTPTSTSTPTSPPSLTPTLTPTAVATVKYPDGQHFTLFYNESSFVMLSRADLPRTMSGFIFERLDDNGKPMSSSFGGWNWQGEFDEIRGGYCVTLKIYGNSVPYLDPRDCKRGYLNVIQFRNANDEQIFWTVVENSPQFRVLWKDEEVARCEMDAGGCEVYIP